MKTKMIFAPPTCEVIEVHGEGVVCTSVTKKFDSSINNETEEEISGIWS